MDAIGRTSSTNSTDFVLAAGYAVALQHQARKTSSPAPTLDFTMSEGTDVTRPNSPGWTSRSSVLSTEGFIPNFASTPFASDVTQSEIALGDLDLGDGETDGNVGATLSTDVRSPRTSGVSTRRRRSPQRGRNTKHIRDCTVGENYALNETNLTTISQRSRVYRSLRSKEYWEKEYAVQSQWIGKVITGSFSRSAVVAYIMECWKTLTKIYSSLRGRPVELQNVIHQYLVNAVKLVEFLIHRGYTEVSTLMNEFFSKIMGIYLRRPRYMCEFCPAWVQSREILRIVCHTPTCVDVLLGLHATVDDLKTAFLKTMTADVASRDLNFCAYVLDQMNNLTSRITQRIQQIQRKKSFGLAF